MTELAAATKQHNQSAGPSTKTVAVATVEMQAAEYRAQVRAGAHSSAQGDQGKVTRAAWWPTKQLRSGQLLSCSLARWAARLQVLLQLVVVQRLFG